MAIINSLQKTTIGYGTPLTFSKTGVTNATNATTTTTFTNAQLGSMVSITAGKIRVKTQNTIALTYPGTGAGVVSSVTVQISDGTNTLILAEVPAQAASALFDFTFDFITDLITVQNPLLAPTIAFVVVMTNVANGQSVLDFELCLEP